MNSNQRNKKELQEKTRTEEEAIGEASNHLENLGKRKGRKKKKR